MAKRFLVLALIAVLAIGVLPTVSAQEGEGAWCGTDQPVNLTFIAGTVGGEHEVYVALAERFMAEACPNVTVKVVERPESTTETLAQYQQFFEGESAELDVLMVDVACAMLAEHLLDISEYADAELLASSTRQCLKPIRSRAAWLFPVVRRRRHVVFADRPRSRSTAWKSPDVDDPRLRPRPSRMVSGARATPTLGLVFQGSRTKALPVTRSNGRCPTVVVASSALRA